MRRLPNVPDKFGKNSSVANVRIYGTFGPCNLPPRSQLPLRRGSSWRTSFLILQKIRILVDGVCERIWLRESLRHAAPAMLTPR
jgi:hypothetical protein